MFGALQHSTEACRLKGCNKNHQKKRESITNRKWYIYKISTVFFYLYHLIQLLTSTSLTMSLFNNIIRIIVQLETDFPPANWGTESLKKKKKNYGNWTVILENNNIHFKTIILLDFNSLRNEFFSHPRVSFLVERTVSPYNSPLQLTLIGHVIVWFLMRYAFNDVRLGLFRNVPSSFFHTYVIAVCSYDTEKMKNIDY